MIYKGVRKNYLLNNQSIISQKKQDSDSYSKKSDSESFKSSNDSLQNNKNNLIKKNVENKIAERTNIGKRGLLFKSRSQSINTLIATSSTIKPTIQLKNPKIQQKKQYIDKQYSQSNLKEKVKLFSTQQPSQQTNSSIYDNNNFVRFSQAIVDLQDKNNRHQNRNHRTPSILKNKKRTISCTKIDSNYLRFRDKVIQQKNSDSNKLKYEKIIQHLKNKHQQRAKRQHNHNKIKEQEKYKDQIFPPTINSIFLTKQRSTQVGKNISGQIIWKRINEIFQDKKLLLYKPNSGQRIIKKEHSIASKDFVFALNALKNIQTYFQKVFENFYYEEHGIYCVKIFEQNVWKYVVIDDFIPVIKHKNDQNQQIFTPLFLSVQSSSQQVQIWPFLIQKAYASYYSNYQSLINCNVQDLIEQLLMSPVKIVKFNQNQQDNEQMSKRLSHIINNTESNKDIIYAKNVKSGEYTLINKKSNSPSQVFIINQKGTRKMKIKNIVQILTDIKIVSPFRLKYFNACYINKVKKPKIGKFQSLARIKIRQQIHIRTFSFQKDGEVQIMLRQKQKRFYERNGINYSYSWTRIILIQKEFSGGYRWIAGKYGNQKSLNICTFLQKGEYQLIVIPEFPSQTFYDITLILLSNEQCAIQKKNYQQDSKLLQNCCMDLAQRHGKFTQINQHMCSYSYIDKQAAVVIENINNERQYGSVALTRSLAGLKSKVQLYPFNIDFCINEYQPDVNKRKFKKSVETLIDADKHFTVVLMMKNGVDHKFLQVFNFGN